MHMWSGCVFEFTLSLSNSSDFEIWINSSICRIFPTSVLHSSIICEEKHLQMSPCLSKAWLTLPLSWVTCMTRCYCGAQTVGNPSGQRLTSNFQRNAIRNCRHGGWILYLWHWSQSLRRCLLLFRPLLCSLQDVLNQQTTTFYFWTQSINRIHFFHLNANKIEAEYPCVFAHGWQGSEFAITLALGHSTEQYTVVTSD